MVLCKFVRKHLKIVMKKKLFPFIVLGIVLTACAKKECTCETTVTENGVLVDSYSKTRELKDDEHCEITASSTVGTHKNVTECRLN